MKILLIEPVINLCQAQLSNNIAWDEEYFNRLHSLIISLNE